jgi:hypothetical protein
MLNAHETEAAIRNLPSVIAIKDRDERVAQDLSNRAARNDLEVQFRSYLEDTYASEIPAGAHGAIFSKAWADGHSSGYGEVEMHYQDLAALALTVLNAK